jgi:hypothetical protein
MITIKTKSTVLGPKQRQIRADKLDSQLKERSFDKIGDVVCHLLTNLITVIMRITAALATASLLFSSSKLFQATPS